MRDFRGLLKLAQTNTPMAAAPGVTTQVAKPAPTASQPPIAKPGVQNATNFDTFTNDQKTLAKLLYDEARGHTADMPYIAAAVYNRSLGTDHVGEVIQPVTFSGMGPDRSFKSWSHRNDNDAEKAAWQEAMKQAMAIYADDYVPPTSATHFAMPNAVASWNNGKTMLPISGVAHRFYDDVRFERPWVATPMPALTSQNMRKHKVAPGENFSKIAQKYGVPTSWIQAWNDKVDPKKLKVGSEILYVPLPAGYISSSATGKQAAEELKEIRRQRLKDSSMNKGAMAYMVGFISKCAEYGVPMHVADGMLKQSAAWEKALLRYARSAKLPKKETYRLWRSVLSRSNPEIAERLPKTLQHVSVEKQLGPWTNGRSRKIYSRLMGEVEAVRNKVFDYIEPRSVPFSKVTSGRSGDFIFKGSDLTSLSNALDESVSKQLWWSHNPAVSMGYTPNNDIGRFHILPIAGDFQKKVHSRFTPHIASGKEADIARAVADKTQRAGHSAAGKAYDYEFVSNADDIPNFLGKTEQWFTFPSRSSLSRKSGDIPVYHGFDVNPNDRYFSQRLFFNDKETAKGLASLLAGNNDLLRETVNMSKLPSFSYGHSGRFPTVSLSPLPSFGSRHKGMFPSVRVYNVMSGPRISRSSLSPTSVHRFD